MHVYRSNVVLIKREKSLDARQHKVFDCMVYNVAVKTATSISRSTGATHSSEFYKDLEPTVAFFSFIVLMSVCPRQTASQTSLDLLRMIRFHRLI